MVLEIDEVFENFEKWIDKEKDYIYLKFEENTKVSMSL